MKDRPFFYLISAILPDRNKTGGEMVLHRHLVERDDFVFREICFSLKKNLFFQRLERSFLRTYIKAFSFYYERFDFHSIKEMPKPAFVLTVAHSRQCYAALAAARMWKVPLVTIFHDWYPASSDVHPSLQWISEISFRKLYANSALAMCVSRQMLDTLGPHPHAILLPPIPSSIVPSGIALPSRSVPRFFYSGFCGGAYTDMINRFIAECSNAKVIARFSGSASGGLTTQSPNVSILGFLPEKDFVRIFEDSDILLIFLSFDPRKRKHFSTHFPSKLVEYCGKDKLIGIWGPAYATAVQWARKTQAAFNFVEDDALGFLRELLIVFNDIEKRNNYIKQAEVIYQREFSPEIIHAKFKKAILNVLRHAKN